MATAAAREKTKQVEKFMNGLVFDAKPEEISLGAFKLFEIIQKVIRNTDERYAKREKHGMVYEWETVYNDIVDIVNSDPNSIVEKRHDGSTIFHVVAENSNILDGRILSFLIKTSPAGLRISNNFGLLPIHKAVMHHDTDVDEVKTLISSYPAGLMAQNIEGLTPLHLAVAGSKASLNAVTLILFNEEFGLKSASVQDKYGHLPLHKAVSRNNPCMPIVTELINAHPGGVRATDTNGLLALHWAVCRIKPCLALLQKLVVSYPLGIEVRDKTGMRAIDRFLLQDARASSSRVLSETGAPAMKEREGIMRLLLHPDAFIAEQKLLEDEEECRWEDEKDEELGSS